MRFPGSKYYRYLSPDNPLATSFTLSTHSPLLCHLFFLESFFLCCLFFFIHIHRSLPFAHFAGLKIYGAPFRGVRKLRPPLLNLEHQQHTITINEATASLFNCSWDSLIFSTFEHRLSTFCHRNQSWIDYVGLHCSAVWS